MNTEGVATTHITGNPSTPGERFAQASAEYQRLAASLSALGVELAALGSALDAPASAPAALPGSFLPSVRTATPPRPLLRAYLLGSFQLMAGSRKLSAEMPGQAQTVLKYLIGHRKRPVSREALLDLLWPDADPAVGNGRLRVVMHTLRKCLSCKDVDGKEFLLPQGGNLTLNPDLPLWVDVEEFEQHWHNGWRLRRDDRPTEAMREYEQAESLYAGDYLADEPYADWTLLRREALRDAYSTILTMLVATSFDLGDYIGTIIWSQKLLGQDDCREDAYRYLMLSHARLGQPARSLHWYKLCVRTLKRELGMEPSVETQALVTACGLHERASHHSSL